MASRKVLVLALGNELLADDGVGPAVAQLLQGRLPSFAELRCCRAAGLELLQEFLGFDAAVVIDAVQTGKQPVGCWRWLRWEELSPVVAPSPHWAGLPEVRAVAQAVGLPFPAQVAVLAVEAEDLTTLGRPLSPAVAASLPQVAEAVLAACSRLAR